MVHLMLNFIKYAPLKLYQRGSFFVQVDRL